MSFRPLGGYTDIPINGAIDDTIDLVLDYNFMGLRNGEILDLHISSQVMDHKENVYKRKGSYILKRIDAKECIIMHVRNHLKDLGVAEMDVKRIMRDFEVDRNKAIEYDLYNFNNSL